METFINVANDVSSGLFERSVYTRLNQQVFCYDCLMQENVFPLSVHGWYTFDTVFDETGDEIQSRQEPANLAMIAGYQEKLARLSATIVDGNAERIGDTSANEDFDRDSLSNSC